jgi:hypothetical protein
MNAMNLHQQISSRLHAGALVVVVEESDEHLALASAEKAAKAYSPVVIMSVTDERLSDALAKLPKGEGTLIVSDMLAAHAGNPIVARGIREVALQLRPDDQPMSHLILLESPGVKIPETLKSDVELIQPKLPDVLALAAELESSIKSLDITDKQIKGHGSRSERCQEIASAVTGLGRHEAARLFARSLIEKEGLDPIWLRREKAIRVSERLGGALTFVDTDTPNVGGLAGLRAWLAARRKAFGSEAARKFGLSEPKGVLLTGIPGTGKSLLAKTVAREWGLPAMRLDIGKLFGSLVGQSEAQARLAIEAAEACSPCVLWIDEIEKGLATGGQDGGTSLRVLGTILTWLQENNKPVFTVATANDISGLPPELLRKGRFDEIFFVDLPTLEERKEIIAIHLKRRKLIETRFSVDKIAAATEGFGGAEIEQAVVDGMFAAFADDRDVNTQDIVVSAEGTSPLAKTMEGKINGIRQWAVGRAKMANAPLSKDRKSTPETLRRGKVAA